MAPEKLTDERLCWLAVRDELDRKVRGSFLVGLARAGRPRGVGRRSSAGEIIGDRLSRYAMAVDELADRLTREEREALRVTGQVPAWFRPAVEKRATELKKAGF